MNCKLVGQYIQYLEVTLSPGERFFSERGSLIYIEDGIRREVITNGSGFSRILGAMLSGESLFLYQLMNVSNMPRKIVIGSRCGLLPVKLDGETMVCHRGMFVASNNSVNISAKVSIAGFTGGMGLFLQEIQGYSTVFLDTIGQPIVINLEPGQTIDVDEDHIIALLNIPRDRLQANWSLSNILGGEGFSMLRVIGPGTVYLSPGKFIEPAPAK